MVPGIWQPYFPIPPPTRPRLETGGSSVEKLTHLGEDTSDGDSDSTVTARACPAAWMRLTYPHALSTVSKLLMVCFQFPDLQCELTDEDHWTLEAGLYKENQRSTPAEEKSSWETGPTQGGGKHKTTKTLRAIRDVVFLKRERDAA